tara:strand:- start:756 stop:1274 length:519 start_codon:yes stop_codon:yes gene_type:complete
MNIREITPTDAYAYRQLRATLDEESVMWGAAVGERVSLGDDAVRQFNAVLGHSGSRIWVAEAGGILVDFLSLETSGWQSLCCTGTLMVGMLSSHQGQGLSKVFFERCELWARKQGIHCVELLVLTNNLSSIGLYKKLGYIKEGIRKQSSYINGQSVDEIYMAKLLTQRSTGL